MLVCRPRPNFSEICSAIKSDSSKKFTEKSQNDSFCLVEFDTSNFNSIDLNLNNKSQSDDIINLYTEEWLPTLNVKKVLNCEKTIPTTSTPQSISKSLFGEFSTPVTLDPNFDYTVILNGAKVYVEVRSEWDDVSSIIATHLVILGAKILRTLSKKATHLVFKNGKLSTYKKALDMKIPIVSVLWIEMCKREKKKVTEEEYAATEPKNLNKSPDIMRFLKRMAAKPYMREFDKQELLLSKPDKNSSNNLESKLKNEPKNLKRKLFKNDTSLFIQEDLACKSVKKLKTRNDNIVFLTLDETPIIREDIIALPTSSNNKAQNILKPILQNLENKTIVQNLENKTIVQNLENKTRKSLDDFKMKKNKRKRTIVLTNVDPSSKEIIYSIVSSIGDFQISLTVNSKTTHIICGEKMRTLNMLFGIVKGCWILSPQWVLDSLDVGKWLEEEKYELKDYYPAITLNRKERELADINLREYKQDLFSSLGNIFISPHSVPPKESLTQIVTMAGGVVKKCIKQCKIIIGKFQSHENYRYLDEKRVLDCIVQHRILTVNEI